MGPSQGVRTRTTFRGHSRLKGIPFIGISLEKLADGDVIASFAGIAAPGSDDDDAVDTLFEVLLTALETYSAEPQLGPVPTRQLQILEQYFDAMAVSSSTPSQVPPPAAPPLA